MTHSLPEIADLLGVSLRTVRLWVATGELRSICVSRNRASQKPRLRVLDSDLHSFLAARTVGTEAPKPSRRRRVKPRKEYV